VYYFAQTLAAASPRIQLEVTGYTHEKRPLLLLTITSEKNHQNLDNIRKRHTDKLNVSNYSISENDPVVVYLAYSVHGNEPSGTGAALMLLYYLAAAEGTEVENLLNNSVILLDPCLNPDGLHRFATWVNSQRSVTTVTDNNDREFSESWPSSRFNHYWFDLNRDWLWVQHPESQARIKTFQKWKPNVLGDYHEMGTNATYFFQPGIAERTHPLTPEMNQKLTARIAGFHSKALDKIGSLYYSGESFDDFYYLEA
jgi:murein tripeptide amidase MpaA